tara:strand:+ start:222 stop:422 length:201 start_codon:yes stop_codon:yes gene_type:complete
MIQVGKLKKAFHDEGLQLSAETVNILNNEIKRTVSRWVRKTKDGNIKRLTPDLIWIVLGKTCKEHM